MIIAFNLLRNRHISFYACNISNCKPLISISMCIFASVLYFLYFVLYTQKNENALLKILRLNMRASPYCIFFCLNALKTPCRRSFFVSPFYLVHVQNDIHPAHEPGMVTVTYPWDVI